jgi:hypothetical protein
MTDTNVERESATFPDSEARDESGDPDGEALAAGETRILSEEEAGIAESDLADSEAATVLADDDDDRTQLVTRPPAERDPETSDAMKATRVIDNAAPPTPPRETDTEAATHDLDLPEDKTSPLPVSAHCDIRHQAGRYSLG